jgi:hypothetical protein
MPFLLHTVKSDNIADHCATMDSGTLTRLLRQLFHHPACKSVKSRPLSSSSSLSSPSRRGYSLQVPSRQQRRSFLTRKASSKQKSPEENGMLWAKRGDNVRDIEEELRAYPLVTANDLRNRRERPKELKMLTREFIDGK